MRINFEQKTVWLTGASSGIGLALAERLLAEGAICILSARHLDPLNTLMMRYPEHCHLLPFDMTDKTSLVDTAAKLANIAPHLDMAILNAGTCEYIDIDHFDPDMVERVMQVNFQGTVNSIAIALPLLKKQPAAQLALMSSTAIYFPFAKAAAYGASKAAIDYFGRSLRVDLKSTNVKLSIIHPGFVKTPLTDRNTFNMPFLMSSEKAAHIISRGLQKGKLSINFPWTLLGLLKLLSLLPERWQCYLAQQLKG